MRAYDFDLHIGAEAWLDYYRGTAKVVVATTHQGVRVQFQAKHLQPFLTRDGVRGTFRLVVDDRNNFVRLEQLTSPAGGWVA
ncbi:MAG: DUF2835 domain-containing protein [Myxococcales bacterium]|nr:DUF2835 domain-containing protein [Myxococcales bacterium]